MNLQNGTLDTRLPQNIIRNFEIPTNVEHDKLNPFKIGGGNAIWATHLPPNVNVWFSTNPNFDNAQKLDYMNRGMRFMSIGSDGLQQQYDNFYIFTEGTWNDTIKIAVSSQGDIVEPILSNNTGDIENVGRVAKITRMPVNGASGYNNPDFEIWCKNKVSIMFVTNKSTENSIAQAQFCDFELLNFIANKYYLLEIDCKIVNSNLVLIGGAEAQTIYPSLISFCFIKNSVLYEENTIEQDPSPLKYHNVNFKNILFNGEKLNFYTLIKYELIKIITLTNFESVVNRSSELIQNVPSRVIVSGRELINSRPVILVQSQASNTFSGFFDFNVRVYSL